MRTISRQPADWLFPRVRRNVLALLLIDGDRGWHLREVVRRTGCAVGTVRRELKGLTACGLVLQTRDGNRTVYQANRASPLYPDLAGLIRKTCGLTDVLRSALQLLADRISVAFVYGSHARGDARPASDVDVMVIGKLGFREVVAALADAQNTLAREINPTVYSPAEFRTKATAGHHFVRSVLSDPRIFLIGDENELGGLAQ